jgi:hypothetical protein
MNGIGGKGGCSLNIGTGEAWRSSFGIGLTGVSRVRGWVRAGEIGGWQHETVQPNPFLCPLLTVTAGPPRHSRSAASSGQLDTHFLFSLAPASLPQPYTYFVFPRHPRPPQPYTFFLIPPQPYTRLFPPSALHKRPSCWQRSLNLGRCLRHSPFTPSPGAAILHSHRHTRLAGLAEW